MWFFSPLLWVETRRHIVAEKSTLWLCRQLSLTITAQRTLRRLRAGGSPPWHACLCGWLEADKIVGRSDRYCGVKGRYSENFKLRILKHFERCFGWYAGNWNSFAVNFFSSILQSALVIAAILRSVTNDYIVICRSRDDRGYLIPSHSAKVLKWNKAELSAVMLYEQSTSLWCDSGSLSSGRPLPELQI